WSRHSARAETPTICGRSTCGSSGSARGCGARARPACCARSTAKATCSTCRERERRGSARSERHRDRPGDRRADVVSVDLDPVVAGALELLVPAPEDVAHLQLALQRSDRKSTRLNSSHVKISYAV